jgi:hypothetical protein
MRGVDGKSSFLVDSIINRFSSDQKLFAVQPQTVGDINDSEHAETMRLFSSLLDDTDKSMFEKFHKSPY